MVVVEVLVNQLKVLYGNTNNMKKKEYSFADEAKRLEKKYKRAKYDPIEKEELTAELRKLREEQESFRADAGIGEEDESMEFAEGGIKTTGYTGVLPNQYFNNLGSIAGAPSLGMDLSKVGLSGATSYPNSASPQYDSLNSSILPSAISTGVSLIGNIAGMIGANKKAKTAGIKIPKMAAEQISLEPQRESLRREAGTARNVILRNARDVSSPGAAYANQIAGVSSIYDSLGAQSGQSYMTEQNTNAQMRQSANQANLESDLRGSMFNAQMRDKYNTEASAYRDAAFQAIPEGLRDYRAQRSQDQWMSAMGKDYGLYQKTNPNATFKEKLMNSLFGNDYGVYSREYINSLNRR